MINNDWVGKDRRLVDKEHGEMLARIDERTKNIEEKINFHSDVMAKHIIDDLTNFKSIKKRIFYMTLSVVVIAIYSGVANMVLGFIK